MTPPSGANGENRTAFSGGALPNLPPLISKLLANAIIQDGHYIFRCQWHGTNRTPDGRIPVATVGTCPECQAIALLIRHSITNLKGDELAQQQLDQVHRAIANACQSERKGTFDFEAAPRGPQNFKVGDEAEEHLRNAIVVTDV